MPRRLIDDLRAGQLTTWSVVRAKCSYGDNHESVRQVGDQWRGESSNSFDCDYAPQDMCSVCAGRGWTALSVAETETAQYDEDVAGGRRRCRPCRGSGYVPGAHWPWRHPHPGPVRRG